MSNTIGQVMPRGNGERILLVEDDADLRQLTERALSGLNYIVVSAEDGPAALERLADHDARSIRFDIVFSDVVMPSGINGIDLYILMCTRYPDTPVLLASGFHNDVLRSTGMSEEDIQQMRILRKPYTRADLAGAINDVLHPGPLLV